jgi:hypothetical protein
VLFFGRNSRKALINQVDIEEVRWRVFGLREIPKQPPQAGILHGMAGSNDSIPPYNRSVAAPKAEPQRYLPHEIPATATPAAAEQASLAELYAMAVEETAAPRRDQQPKQPERVLPDQIPTTPGLIYWE